MVKSDCTLVVISNETLHGFILKSLSESPYATVLVNGKTGEEISFEKFILTTKKLALGLENVGIKKGDVVAILAENGPEYLYSLLAIMMNGAAPLMVNPSYKTYELEQVLKTTKAKWWFTISSLHSNLIQAIKKANIFIEGIILMDAKQRLPSTTPLTSLTTHPASTPSQVPHPAVMINPKTDPALILLSSGTTGLPKAVVLSHRNVVCLLSNFRSFFSSPAPSVHRQQQVSLVALPIFHVFGMVGVTLHALASCHKLVLLSRFQPEEAFACIERYKVTTTALVPTIIIYMCKNKDIKQKYDLSSLKTILTGAAPLSKDTEKEFVDLYCKGGLSQGYGLTETSMAVVLNIPGRPIKKGSAGQVIPNSEVIVRCLETDKELGPHKSGEIWIRSEQVMLGYLNNPEATIEMIDEHGWLHSGDIGYYDEEGYFFITGRLKDLIKYKGFQISPTEIETLLLSHPSINEAVVVGVPDHISGELSKAFVVKKLGHSLTEEEVKNLVATRLSSYKHLRGGVEFLASIPRTGSGKYLRRALVERSIKPTSKL